MKKRFIAFLCVLVIVLASVCTSFAGSLEITKITPKDGYKSAQPANMAVKVSFSEDMIGNPDIQKNASKFVIKDANGKAQPFTMVYSEKYPNELWLILDGTLEVNAAYTVEIGKGITSSLGNETTEVTTSTFKTRNTKTDSLISTLLTFVMFGGILAFSAIQSKKQQREEQILTVAQVEKLNPYKISKAKGISFEEAQKYIAKERAKAEKEEAKRAELRRQKEAMAASELAAIEAEVDSEERRNGWFRVHTKCSFKDHGHAIPKSVKKRYAEKKRKAEERAKKYARNKKKK